MNDLHIEPGSEGEPTRCECCGSVSRTVWGYVYANDTAVAAYFVQWTQRSVEHPPSFDFLVGTWGDDSVHDKKLISWVYRPTPETGGFAVIDSEGRPAAASKLCQEALSRDQVLGDKALFTFAKRMIDAVWLGDPRIEEVKRLASA